MSTARLASYKFEQGNFNNMVSAAKMFACPSCWNWPPVYKCTNNWNLFIADTMVPTPSYMGSGMSYSFVTSNVNEASVWDVVIIHGGDVGTEGPSRFQLTQGKLSLGNLKQQMVLSPSAATFQALVPAVPDTTPTRAMRYRC